MITGWRVLNDRVHVEQRHVDGARRLRPVDRQERFRGEFSLLVSCKLFLFFLANKMLTATLANHRARGCRLCRRCVRSTPHLTKALPREGDLLYLFSFLKKASGAQRMNIVTLVETAIYVATVDKLGDVLKSLLEWMKEHK